MKVVIGLWVIAIQLSTPQSWGAPSLLMGEDSKSYALSLVTTRDPVDPKTGRRAFEDDLGDYGFRYYTQLLGVDGVGRSAEFPVDNETKALSYVKEWVQKVPKGGYLTLVLAAHGNYLGMGFGSSETPLSTFLNAIKDARVGLGPMRRIVIIISACQSGYYVDDFEKADDDSYRDAFNTGILITSTGRDVGGDKVFKEAFAKTTQTDRVEDFLQLLVPQVVEYSTGPATVAPQVSIVPFSKEREIRNEPLWLDHHLVTDGWMAVGGHMNARSNLLDPKPSSELVSEEPITLKMQKTKMDDGSEIFLARLENETRSYDSQGLQITRDDLKTYLFSGIDGQLTESEIDNLFSDNDEAFVRILIRRFKKFDKYFFSNGTHLYFKNAPSRIRKMHIPSTEGPQPQGLSPYVRIQEAELVYSRPKRDREVVGNGHTTTPPPVPAYYLQPTQRGLLNISKDIEQQSRRTADLFGPEINRKVDEMFRK